MQLKNLFKGIFFEKTDKTHIQFFRYLFVGGFAAFIDIGSLFILTDFLKLHYLLSAALAFILGIATNYILSIRWIFKSTGNVKKEIILFLSIGVGGLFLNELIIWFLVEKMLVYYMYTKLISTAIVLFWNFGMRKKFVFS